MAKWLMNKTEFRHKILWPIYKVVKRCLRSPLHLPVEIELKDSQQAIKDLLQSDNPCMIARFGGTEIRAIIAHENHRELKNCFSRLYHKLKLEPATYDNKIKWMMQNYSGFFPPSNENMARFATLMIEDAKQLDLLAVWRAEEVRLKKYFPQARHLNLGALEPFLFEDPWSEALKGKKVLLIHPFIESIVEQYQKHEKLFEDPNVLPIFELKCIKAVQSIAGNDVEYKDWFEALDYMKNEIDKTDFDIAIIGAGAYGFPLAAHIKRIGKKAVHMGGITQMLFGIKGNRWEGCECYQHLFNEHWTKPSVNETPKNSNVVENNTYW